MYRSGSTLQFNILRVLLEQHYGSVYSCFESDYDPENKHFVHLIKTHSPNTHLANLSDFIFSSIRLKSEIMESMDRRREYNDAILAKDIVFHLDDWLFWAEKANFIQSYSMIKNKAKLISMYSLILNIACNIDRVLLQLDDEMIVPSKPQLHPDPKTLLHYGHITKKTI